MFAMPLMMCWKDEKAGSALRMEEELATPDVLDGPRFALQIAALLDVNQVTHAAGVAELVSRLHAAHQQLLLDFCWPAHSEVWSI